MLFPSLLSARSVVLRGRVVNASKDSLGVGRIAVTLLQYKHGDMAPQELQQTRTTSNGRFRFVIQFPDSLVDYYASVDYLGLRYYSKGAHYHTGIREQIGNVVVYDTSSTAGSLQPMMHHIFFDDLGRTLQVREMHIVSNTGRYAVMNAAKDEQGNRATFIFKLPFNAENFRNLSMQRQIVQEGQYIYDRSVVLPGNTQISFSYELPWRNNALQTNLSIPPGTRTLDIFVSNPQISLSSDQLQDLGPFTIRNVRYHRYGAENLGADHTLQLHIRRLVVSTESPLTTIIIMAFLLILGLGYASIKSGRPTMSSARKPHLEKRKNELIKKIASIDAHLETSSNTDEEQERQKLFAELEAIEMELQRHKKSAKK